MGFATVSTIVLSSFSSEPALADGVAVYGGASVGFSLLGGRNLRSNLDVWTEAEFGDLYVGTSFWVGSDRPADVVDLSLGYRSVLESGLAYDLSYTHSYYPYDGGACCGTVALSLSRPVKDRLMAAVSLSFTPEDDSADAHLNLDYRLNDKISLSGGFGLVHDIKAPVSAEWRAGASYALGHKTRLDLRYSDGSVMDSQFGLYLTWDATTPDG